MKNPVLTDMIPGLLFTDWRSIKNQPFFTFLNTFGLAIGMAGALIISLYIYDELNYDNMFEEDFTLDAPYLLPTAKVFSGVLNLPLDRVYTKYKNLEGAMNSDLETWQRVALVAGFQDWQLGFDASKETFKPADYEKALEKYLEGGRSKSTSKSKDYEKALEKYLSR